MIDAIGDLGPGDLSPVLDIETSDGMSLTTVVNNARIWLDRVEAATGRTPIIYAASGFWNTLPNTAQFERYPLWVANYGVTCPDVPSPWDSWDMWQYSDSGSVSGVAGGVDSNLFNGTLEELMAFAGGEQLPIEVYWTRLVDGSYDLRALASPEIVRVEYRVDGYPIGGATLAEGSNFPDNYAFTVSSTERLFEVIGYDATDVPIGRGVGLMDVTPDMGVFIKQLGDSIYEIGLERAPSAVAAIEVEVDGQFLLVDATEGDSRSERKAVRSTFSTLGEREFAISTFNADGSLRGTLYRTFVLE